MSIIINGIKMPEAPDEMIELAIYGDGIVIQTGESWRSPEDGKCYWTVTNPEKFGRAVSVPEHGELKDADAIERNLLKMQQAQTGPCSHGVRKSRAVLRNAPTIIPAEEGKT